MNTYLMVYFLLGLAVVSSSSEHNVVIQPNGRMITPRKRTMRSARDKSKDMMRMEPKSFMEDGQDDKSSLSEENTEEDQDKFESMTGLEAGTYTENAKEVIKDEAVLKGQGYEDEDQDYLAQQEEMARYAKSEGFMKFDTNGDGFVDDFEAVKHGDDESWGNTLSEFDRDGDGKLSTAEFEALVQKRRSKSREYYQLLEQSKVRDVSSDADFEAMIGNVTEHGTADDSVFGHDTSGAVDDVVEHAHLLDEMLGEGVQDEARGGKTQEESHEDAWAKYKAEILLEENRTFVPPCAPEDSKEAFETVFKATADVLSTTFCWRKTYDRGVGKPAGCKADYEQRAAICYKKCDPGWFRSNGLIEHCQKSCGPGRTDIGLFCRTNGHTKSKSCCGRCWPKNWCCRTHCCGGCPSGYTNTGCFCEPQVSKQSTKYSPGKTKYDSRVVGCGSDQDGPISTPFGFSCYPKPPLPLPPPATSGSQIKATHGVCLDANQRSTSGGKVHMWACDTNNQNQQWTYNAATGQIKATHGVCLDASQRSTSGGKVHMWACDTNNQNQHWTMPQAR